MDVASSVANDITMNDVITTTGAANAVGAIDHNENDVTVTVAGFLWRYGDWRHVASGCIALVATDGRH